MAKGSSSAATGAATSAQNISNTEAGNSQGAYDVLAPSLESEIANPQGFSPETMAGMTTAAEQTGGGTQAAAVGQGALHDARTRNAGGADAAVAQSARGAGQQVSQGVLSTQLANARLKSQQQQQGMSGLEGLYGTSTGASVNALGQVASNVNANTNAENASYDWATEIMDPLLGDATKGGAAVLNYLK